MGISQRRFENQLGRPLEDRELEPMNRVQAEFAKHFTAVDYALALSGVAQYRRTMQSWWHEGWDLLLTPTVAELPLKLGTIVNDPDEPDVTDAARGRIRAVHSPVQHQRPTSDQPPAGVDGRGLAGRRAAGRGLRARRRL